MDEGRLQQLADDAAAAWPAITVDDFVGRLRARAADGADLETLHAPEYYLATACVANDPAAMRAFEARYLPAAELALSRFDNDLDFRAEALQELRIRLFAADQPRIAAYDGSGSLEGWIKVVAVRIGLNLKKSTKRHVPVAEVPEPPISDAPDPELEILRSRYRGDFTAALRAAFDDLPADARRILRFYLIDKLNIAEIGALVGASRATVGRRVVECRRILLDGTRSRLREKLEGATTAEIDSVVRLVASRFELTLSKVLT